MLEILRAASMACSRWYGVWGMVQRWDHVYNKTNKTKGFECIIWLWKPPSYYWKVSNKILTLPITSVKDEIYENWPSRCTKPGSKWRLHMELWRWTYKMPGLAHTPSVTGHSRRQPLGVDVGCLSPQVLWPPKQDTKDVDHPIDVGQYGGWWGPCLP